MTARPRQMRLTPRLVALVPPHSGPPGQPPAGAIHATDADHAETVARLLADHPAGADLWVFAYGSLIWNPAFDHDADCIAHAPGWHRAFCLGWNTVFRGSPARPGLMLALDRGGSCKGVAYRLPRDAWGANLLRLLQRECPFKPSSIPARWITIKVAQGSLRALAFPIDRTSSRYVAGLTLDQTAAALATAAGERGSMADYRCSTVSRLEAHGIHDRYLWHLQDRVARLLEGQAVQSLRSG